MQDRFRFRAWNKTGERMTYDTEQTYDFMIGLGTENHFNFGYVLEDKDYEVMQCTGLKDKNGKLIFDKDILEQPNGIRDVVEWSDGCYIHNGTAITNYDSCYQGDKWAKEVNTHKILGNIYQNPELLESEEE